jgi:hypothetical protein
VTEDTGHPVTPVTDSREARVHDAAIEVNGSTEPGPLEEVTQMADKKVTPKAPSAAKAEKSDDKKPAARVSLKKQKKMKKQ